MFRADLRSEESGPVSGSEKAPGSLSTDGLLKMDQDFFNGLMSVASERGEEADREKVRSAVKWLNTKIRGPNGDEQIDANRIRVHTVSNVKMKEMGQKQGLTGIPRFPGAVLPQDLIYAHGIVDPATGVLHIYTTEAMWESITSEKAPWNFFERMLAEFVDHEYFENIEASELNIPPEQRHARAAERAGLIAREHLLSPFHDFFLREVNRLGFQNRIRWYRDFINEARDSTRSESIAGYEYLFRRKVIEAFMDVLVDTGFIKNTMERYRYRDFIEQLDLKEGQKYLHVGSSLYKGVFVLSLLGVDCTFLDVDPGKLGDAEAEFLRAKEAIGDVDATDISFVNGNIDSETALEGTGAGSFDTISLFHILYDFAGDRGQAIHNVLSLVKDGGVLWFTPRTQVQKTDISEAERRAGVREIEILPEFKKVIRTRMDNEIELEMDKARIPLQDPVYADYSGNHAYRVQKTDPASRARRGSAVIIKGIFQSGLMSPKMIAEAGGSIMGSKDYMDVDEREWSYVHCCFVHPKDASTRIEMYGGDGGRFNDALCRDALYNPDYGAMHVVTERSYPDELDLVDPSLIQDRELTDILSERARHSFMLVIDARIFLDMAENSLGKSMVTGYLTQREFGLMDFPQVQESYLSSVPRAAFKAVIIPAGMQELYKDLLPPDLERIIVPDERFYHIGIQRERKEDGEITEIQREASFQGPDYAAALSEYVDAHPNEPLLTHIVRLESPQDIEKKEALAQTGRQAKLPDVPRSGFADTLTETFGGEGAIRAIVDIGPGHGEWMRTVHSQPWVASDAVVVGYDLKTPKPYGHTAEEVLAAQGDLVVYRDVSEKGFPGNGTVDLIHDAFMDSDVDDYNERREMYDRLLRDGGYVLIALNISLNGPPEISLDWYRRNGYEVHVYDFTAGIPKDYPVTRWWNIMEDAYPKDRFFDSGNYLIVARKTAQGRQAKAPASPSMDEDARVDRDFFNGLISVASERGEEADREKVRSAVKWLNTKIRGPNGDEPVDAGKVSIHTVSGKELASIAQDENILGIPRFPGAHLPQDLIYAHGTVDPVTGRLHIFMTETMWERVEADEAGGRYARMLAEFIDHEQFENVEAPVFGISRDLRHRRAAERARFFAVGGQISPYHDFFIEEMSDHLSGEALMHWARRVFSEARDPFRSKAVSDYERNFLQKIHENIPGGTAFSLEFQPPYVPDHYEWDNERLAKQYVRDAVRRNKPHLWELFEKRDQLDSEGKKDLLRQFYSISKDHFALWGLRNALGPLARAHFQGSHKVAILESFHELADEMGMELLGFGYRYGKRQEGEPEAIPEETLESLRFAIRFNRPDLWEAARPEKWVLTSEEEKRTVREEFYKISKANLLDWGLETGVSKQWLISAFEHVDLEWPGLEASWETRDKGFECIRHAFRRFKPDVWRKYRDWMAIPEADRDTLSARKKLRWLQEQIYLINISDFEIWGFVQATSRRDADYFHDPANNPEISGKASFRNVLISVFPELELEQRGFGLEWVFDTPEITREEAIKNVQYALKWERPELWERYRRLESMDQDAAEDARNTLRGDFYAINSYCMKAWGIYGAVSKADAFQHDYRIALRESFPALGIDIDEMEEYKKEIAGNTPEKNMVSQGER